MAAPIIASISNYQAGRFYPFSSFLAIKDAGN
jgi:hypothetical protein